MDRAFAWTKPLMPVTQVAISEPPASIASASPYWIRRMANPSACVEVVHAVAIARFGPAAAKLAVSSTKSMTGHLLGAAGAVEAIFSVLALRDQIAPPTINLDHPGEGCDLDYVPKTARKMAIEHVLSNSFGFGGTNGTLIFRRI